MCNWGLNSEPGSHFVFQLGFLHKDACEACEEAPTCCATFSAEVYGSKGIPKEAMENWIHSLVASQG